MNEKPERIQQVERTRAVLKEAYECVTEQIGLTDPELPIAGLDFEIRNTGIAVGIHIFTYDI